jgi:hypothetical protein
MNFLFDPEIWFLIAILGIFFGFFGGHWWLVVISVIVLLTSFSVWKNRGGRG